MEHGVLTVGAVQLASRESLAGVKNLGAVVASAIVVIALAGCAGGDVDVAASACVEGECTVTIDGIGSEAEVLDPDIDIELVGIASGTATVEIEDVTVECAEGDVVEAGSRSITCSEIGDDNITLEWQE